MTGLGSDDMYLGSVRAPLVSVIVLSYNFEAFIDQCLLSIARQTYVRIECIVFDNASTDGSVRVAEAVEAQGEFAVEGRSLAILRSDVNLYQTPAAAQAVRHANGPYVIFIDGDDVMLPTCVEAHVRAMLSMRIPVGATCVDYLVTTGDDVTISSSSRGFAEAVMASSVERTFCREVALPRTGRERDLDLPPRALHLLDRDVASWSWSGTGGLCFRRNLVELLLRRVPDLREQVDAYLIHGVNCLTGSVLVDRPLVAYRHHDANVFAGGPRMANLNFYDGAALREVTRKVADELLETFAVIARDLAQCLDWNDIFIQAVGTFAAIRASADPSVPAHVCTLAFLRRHEAELVAAFGVVDVGRWMSAAVRARDAVRRA